MRPTLLALVSALASPLAMAHSLWIAPAGSGEMQVQYGEPEIRLNERSPGKLDHLVLLRAERTAGAQTRALTWQLRGTGFMLQGGLGEGGALAQARSTGVRNNPSSPGGVHTLYHSRRAPWPLQATPAAMALDIVPAGEPNLFAIHFRDAPLRQGTLKVIAPSLWIQVHDIDTQGRVRIDTPWRGEYVLEVETREPRTGEVSGQRYDTLVHRATLSFAQPEGLVVENPRPAQYRAE
ncbi:hypothetical protein [Ideonella sp. BN130291]|uniref:hypothetical protein n=1 Tax=Ideonella sp. BN130291 TaxID=3112940 RepID=UPI002E26BFE4|nr:hypothetical protein [Ideonella sp. BN130291]